MLGEAVGRKSRVAVLLGTGRNLRPVQSLGLGPVEPEHEIFRKARGVALDLLVQALGGDAVEAGKLGIQGSALLVGTEDSENAVLAAGNNPFVRTTESLGVNVYDLLKYDQVVFSKEAILALQEVVKP